MMMLKRILVVWVATAGACGCVDVDLLDEVKGVDGGLMASDGPPVSGPRAENDDSPMKTADSAGPPVSDPADESPPSIGALTCAAEESSMNGLCLSCGTVSCAVRFSTDEPARVVPKGQSAQTKLLSDDWGTAHHLALFPESFEREQPFDWMVEDVSGNAAAGGITAATREGARVVITEILADPLGPEPAQEFVEIVNLGSSPVDLSGWTIDDNGDFNGDELPADSRIEPGQVGLIVSPDFSWGASAAAAAVPGVLLVRLDSSIGSNGLKNSEAETVELRDADGTLVSRYGGSLGPPLEGTSVIRIDPALPDADPLAFAPEPSSSSTPGRLPQLTVKTREP